MTRTQVHIRWMIRRDMPGVLEIEQLCFADPWTEREFIQKLRQRNCIGMIAEHENDLVGYMLYELCKTHLRILNFAVHPSCWRRGVGATMAGKLVGKLSPQRRTHLTMRIREGNVAAQCFWRAMGARCVGVTRGCYDSTDEDGYEFELSILEPALQESHP